MRRELLIHRTWRRLQERSWYSTLFLATGVLLAGVVPAIHAVPSGGYARPEVLIQPEELNALIEAKVSNVRIIDMRDNVQYLLGHVPGAVQVWRPDIEDKNHPLPGMMASEARIEELLGNMGVSDSDTLIIYTSSDGPDNGRLWWILAYYGFPLRQIKLLDGGIDAWKVKGYPTEIMAARIEKTRFEFTGKGKARQLLLCTLPEVKSALKASDKVVLDVRSKKELTGEEVKKGASKGGRIPGVTWIEWNEVLVEEDPFKGYWKPAEKIQKIFSAKGVTPDKDIYMY